MGSNSRKLVFGIYNHVRLKTVCSATDTSWNIEIWHETILLSRELITKALRGVWWLNGKVLDTRSRGH